MKKYISMILILVLVATTLVGCGGSKLNDGTYTGEAAGMSPGLKVSVVVADGKISSVDVTEHAETEGYSEPALEQIPGAIVEKNSTDVDAVSGATLTSNAIKEAVNQALEGAK
ncbi:MAG: FMN-binding protein [Tissierellia bacterium]|nr:FMN-binding protein [Tissierellia bacterium]